ncbi:Rdx family-domain-containing protein, partial [Terfezia claveryi]
PHITIQYCTQCKWMLRAAYFAQELLSTFSSTPLPTTTTISSSRDLAQQFTLPTISLVPSTGGIFTITLYYIPSPIGHDYDAPHIVEQKVLWDRKTEGGFPETKELKRRVRDVVDPGRGLGHVDRDYGKREGPREDEGKKG